MRRNPGGLNGSVFVLPVKKTINERIRPVCCGEIPPWPNSQVLFALWENSSQDIRCCQYLGRPTSAYFFATCRPLEQAQNRENKVKFFLTKQEETGIDMSREGCPGCLDGEFPCMFGFNILDDNFRDNWTDLIHAYVYPMLACDYHHAGEKNESMGQITNELPAAWRVPFVSSCASFVTGSKQSTKWIPGCSDVFVVLGELKSSSIVYDRVVVKVLGPKSSAQS